MAVERTPYTSFVESLGRTANDLKSQLQEQLNIGSTGSNLGYAGKEILRNNSKVAGKGSQGLGS